MAKHGFLAGLVLVLLITLLDQAGLAAAAGRWAKDHHGPDAVIVGIFLLSGFALSPGQLRAGLMDLGGTLLALFLIFIVAPLVAIFFSLFPLDTGVVVGLFLVAVMPSTLSSGVVMTASARGDAAHALVVTVSANALSVVTIPLTLALLLAFEGLSGNVRIDTPAMMLEIAGLVVLPLATGMAARSLLRGKRPSLDGRVSVINQGLVLFIVWIAMSQTREILVASGGLALVISALVFAFHGLLLIAAWTLARIAGRPPGKRESILFIGAQKTLPLSVILQISLFPEFGVALLVCVLHHMIHLMMDAYLVQRLRLLHMVKPAEQE